MAEPANLFTITAFFKADPNCVKKGLNSYESGRLCSVTVLEDGVLVGKVVKKKV